MVFRGNHAYEEYLPTQVVSWGNITADLGKACPGCTVNAFAAQGYNEARAQTNDFEKTRNAYYGQGLVFSITGHGLGGMHALIASVDFNQQDIAWYSHNYGECAKCPVTKSALELTRDLQVPRARSTRLV